jgi:hypothetical protein
MTPIRKEDAADEHSGYEALELGKQRGRPKEKGIGVENNVSRTSVGIVGRKGTIGEAAGMQYESDQKSWYVSN